MFLVTVYYNYGFWNFSRTSKPESARQEVYFWYIQRAIHDQSHESLVASQAGAQRWVEKVLSGYHNQSSSKAEKYNAHDRHWRPNALYWRGSVLALPNGTVLLYTKNWGNCAGRNFVLDRQEVVWERKMTRIPLILQIHQVFPLYSCSDYCIQLAGLADMGSALKCICAFDRRRHDLSTARSFNAVMNKFVM